MATDWMNVAGLGLRFAFPASMIPTSVEPSCTHPEREGNAFCPTCGRKVDETTLRDDSEVHAAEEAVSDALPKGYVIRATDFNDDWNRFFIGYGLLTSHQGGPFEERLPIPDIAEVERTIAAALEPYGVVILDPFGLHSYMTAS